MTNPQNLASSLLCVLWCALPLGAQGRGGGGGGGSPPPTPDIVYTNGKLTSGTRPLWVMSSDGSSPRQVLGEDCKFSYPSLSPEGLQVAFTKTRSGVSAVWVINSDGAGLHAVTPILLPIVYQTSNTFPGTRAVWSPAPAPDQQRKLLFADTPDPRSVPWQLFVVNLDGTGRTQLTNQSGLHLRSPASYEWSSDAGRIVYLADDGPVIVTLGLSNGQLVITEQTLVPPPVEPNRLVSVGWANSSDQLVLTGQNPAHGLNRDLWLVDPSFPLTALQITNTADDEALPTFSADDSRIYFWNYSSAAPGTYSIPADGSGSRVLINAKAQNPYHRRG